ncbi:MAG: site-specific integrase [Chloroflexota bacterium]|nr:site-specific integrase [Chloroflexota bacterium]
MSEQRKRPEKRRRGAGEGSIIQRADGRWEAKITVGYVGRTQKRKSIYGKTRKEVAEQLAKLLHEQQQGLPVAPERQNVEQFLTQWLTDVVATKTRASTYERYRIAVKKHLIPHLGHIQLAKLTPQHVQHLLKLKQQQDLAPTHVQRLRDILRNALNHAVKWGLVARNVASLAEPPKVEDYEPRILTPAEAQHLLEAAKGDRLEALWRVALSLGLRRGEVLGLQWDDIDWQAGTLMIRRQLQYVQHKLQLTPLKTKKSRRTLPLSPVLIRVLRQHHARQLEERLWQGDRWRDQNLVFPSNVGTPLFPRNLLRARDALLARAGLPHIRVHDLRHSCASFLIAQGESAKTVQEILGHSDVYITLNTYTHLFEGATRQALSGMDALLGDVEEAG